MSSAGSTAHECWELRYFIRPWVCRASEWLLGSSSSSFEPLLWNPGTNALDLACSNFPDSWQPSALLQSKNNQEVWECGALFFYMERKQQYHAFANLLPHAKVLTSKGSSGQNSTRPYLQTEVQFWMKCLLYYLKTFNTIYSVYTAYGVLMLRLIHGNYGIGLIRNLLWKKSR